MNSYLYKCAKLSDISYSDKVDELESFHTMKSRFKRIIFIENASVSCFVFKNTSSMYIVFRGVDSLNDIATCMNYKLKRFDNNNSLIHEGYLEAYNSIKDYIMRAVQDQNIKHLTFVGHSMGGALSVLSAYDVKKYVGNKSISCVTFGCPPVGNITFANNFYNNIYRSFRVTNDHDLIPCIPILRHVHGEIKLKVADTNIINSKNMYTRLVLPHKIECYVNILRTTNIIKRI